MTSSNSAQMIAGLVLAGGKGTRMKSGLTKVLHPVLGKPILSWVLETLRAAGIDRQCLVLPQDTEPFQELIRADPKLTVCVQMAQRGTGDAVAAAAPAFPFVTAPDFANGKLLHGDAFSQMPYVLICYGDTPAVPAAILKAFVADALQHAAPIAVIAMNCPDPTGYGRILRNSKGDLDRIVEERDADALTRAVTLCNTGITFARIPFLFELLASLKTDNAQNEYYLTDCFRHAASRGENARIFVSDSPSYFAGVNDRAQLAAVERHLLERKRAELMRSGVTLMMPESIYVEDSVTCGPDTIIEPGCILRGQVSIGRGCRIGAQSILENVTIGAATSIAPCSVIGTVGSWR